MQNRQQIQRLTTQALLIVIIVLQDLIPMIGNLPLGPLSITTCRLPSGWWPLSGDRGKGWLSAVSGAC